jgi:hypothetical protein
MKQFHGSKNLSEAVSSRDVKGSEVGIGKWNSENRKQRSEFPIHSLLGLMVRFLIAC